eukprot:313185_1
MYMSRGHNVVILNANNGQVIDKKIFDTYAWGSQTGSQLLPYVKELMEKKDEVVIIISVVDTGEGKRSMEAHKMLPGCEIEKLNFRTPFIYVGSNKGKRKWTVTRLASMNLQEVI